MASTHTDTPLSWVNISATPVQFLLFGGDYAFSVNGVLSWARVHVETLSADNATWIKVLDFSGEATDPPVAFQSYQVAKLGAGYYRLAVTLLHDLNPANSLPSQAQVVSASIVKI